jgi:hypothetical protein
MRMESDPRADLRARYHIAFFHGITQLDPSIQAAKERLHSGESKLLQFQRHTGARGFAGSSAVEDNAFVQRQLMRALCQVFRIDMQGSGNAARIVKHIKRVPEINQNQIVLAQSDL